MAKRFEQYLSRRILTEQGWMFFCRICGDYKPESTFYKSSKTQWGIDTKCKSHYKKYGPTAEDKTVSHLKLGPIRESDFYYLQVFLEKMGYEFGPDKPTVHEQFLERMKKRQTKLGM